MIITDSNKSQLTLAVDIGARMLCCGAEVYRVEDSIQRLLMSTGATEVDVFSITSSIVVTAFWQNTTETQTRRITETGFNMTKLIALNELSRQLCREDIAIEDAYQRLFKIDTMPEYSKTASCGIFALISCSFSVFFGGSFLDAVLSAAIGVLLFFIRELLLHKGVRGIMSIVILSIIGGLAAHGAKAIGLGCSPQHIAIGNIMILVPGISLTNAIRDMFTGDTIAGTLRLAESILLSLALALGFAIPVLLF